MARILVMRFSAIGDVAMTVPVVYSLARRYPGHEIKVLSRPGMAALFAHAPENVTFRGADLKNDYRGIAGLNRLYRELAAENPDCIADLHDVLRTQWLRLRFRLNGKKVKSIDKGRNGKRALTRARNKRRVQQDSSFTRYANVLSRLGFPVEVEFRSIYGTGRGDVSAFCSVTGEKGADRWVGVAPFAQHKGKIYPVERMEEVVKQLDGLPGVKVMLFGGGKKEVDVLSAWERRYANVTCIAGKLSLEAELALMSHLDGMVSMDSGNMHLASLVGVPVVSVWGATHPLAGFMGWNQSEADAVQRDLPCRPCSVYGNRPCRRKDYACMEGIRPKDIVERVRAVIGRTSSAATID